MTEVKEFTGKEIVEKLNEEQKSIIATIHANNPQGVAERLFAEMNKKNKKED